MSHEFSAGERLYIGHGVPEEERRHRERYSWALGFISRGGRVLDAASGSGYGSEILRQKAGEVIGLEVNEHALTYAKAHHAPAGVSFNLADLNALIDLPSDFFDTVVSFETLEHVNEQDRLLSEFKRVLKSGGTLVISTPDRDILTDEDGGENKFHVKGLSKKEFIDLIAKFFSVEKLYGQIRHIPITLWKKLIKLAARLDVIGVKRWVTKKFKLQRAVHSFFNAEENTNIIPLSLADKKDEQYYHLILIARKK